MSLERHDQRPVGEHSVDDAVDQCQHPDVSADDQGDVTDHQQVPLHGSHSSAFDIGDFTAYFEECSRAMGGWLG